MKYFKYLIPRRKGNSDSGGKFKGSLFIEIWDWIILLYMEYDNRQKTVNTFVAPGRS